MSFPEINDSKWVKVERSYRPAESEPLIYFKPIIISFNEKEKTKNED